LIRITEEPYDGPVASALVQDLLADLNRRYAHELGDLTPADIAAGDADYLAEVTADQVRRPVGAFLVAWLGDEPVGCGALRPGGEPGEAEVKRMYTRPTGRGQGIGRVLLQCLEALATELGYERGRLETGTGQPEAMALYASEGWTPIPAYGRYQHSASSRCFAKVFTPS
jgi:GNAT superfamily N-acetyltransferase